MAHLTRLSVLLAEPNSDRTREIASLLQELGVGHTVHVESRVALLDALGKQAFDVLLCAERLGDDDGVRVLREARGAAPATRTVLMRANQRAAERVPEDIEAIELPFSRLTLQGLLHRAAAPRGGLWCEVPELSLSDILQMYHQARRSITVLLSGPIAGRIRLEAGEIVDAEANDERGMPALSRLLEAESGLVRTEPPRSGGPHTISAPFQSVLLEAAQKLDERRRDRLASPAISRPIISVPSGSPSTAGGDDPGRFGQDYRGGDRYLGNADTVAQQWVGHDLRRASGPSVEGNSTRPAMTPLQHGPAPHRHSRPGPSRVARRHAVLTTLGVLAAVLFVAVAASYLGRRLGERQALTAASDEASAHAPSLSTSEAVPPSPPPPPDDRGDAPRAGEAAAAQRDVSSDRAARPLPLPDPLAGSVAEPTPPAPARVSSFALHITSRPSRATVFEASRMLGKTPLTVTIGASSVADTPREFVVRLPGHFPSRVYQGPSAADVSAKVVLVPRPAVTEAPDGGVATSESDGTGARPDGSRPRRKDLGIRLRR